MTPGCVYLVGAGPGDPGLITVKGPTLLRGADVVIYDRLVSRELLDEVAPDAIRINAGKVAGCHAIDQNQINTLLVQHWPSIGADASVDDHPGSRENAGRDRQIERGALLAE